MVSSMQQEGTHRPHLEGQLGLVLAAHPELVAALARELAAAHMRIAIAAADPEILTAAARGLPEAAEVATYIVDPTHEDEIDALYDAITERWGVPDLVVHERGALLRASVLHTAVAELERCWRTGCLSGFFVGRCTARRMVGRGSGTIVYTGTNASWRGAAGSSSLAVEEFGVRALAQSMARELGPRGIHVAHLVIDGEIVSPDNRDRAELEVPAAFIAPRAIASTCLHLHQQHRSAWTHELDLRPWVEEF
jgi:NAD(P)-dependent dehydrogenase (short-subunit alcohol dehydrogenase family)